MAQEMMWLKTELAKGLTMFTLLRLKNPPPSEASHETIEIWYRALTFRRDWVEELDRKRLEEAFCWVAQNSDTFPTPKQVLEAMSPREIKALPEPPITPEQQAKCAERWAALKQQCKGFKCS